MTDFKTERTKMGKFLKRTFGLVLLLSSQFTFAAMYEIGVLDLPIGRDGMVNGINNAGHIVGYTAHKNGDYRAFIYKNGKMQNLGALDGKDSVAAKINDAGEVVGLTINGKNGNGDTHAFLYKNGKMQNLGALDGKVSMATGINDAGQVVGSIGKKGRSRPFLYKDGKLQDLGKLGNYSVEPFDINDAGHVVGLYTPLKRAFLYKNGDMQDLGTLGGEESSAYGINNAGHVVGFSHNVKGQRRAFLWENGNMIDLNTKINLDGIEVRHLPILNVAHAVNDKGQIVASSSRKNAGSQFYILNPTNDTSSAVSHKGYCAMEDIKAKACMKRLFFGEYKCDYDYATVDAVKRDDGKLIPINQCYNKNEISNYEAGDSSGYGVCKINRDGIKHPALFSKFNMGEGKWEYKDLLAPPFQVKFLTFVCEPR